MIDRQLLLERIDEALEAEASAVPLFGEALPAILPCLPFGDGERAAMDDTLRQLHDDSARHRATLASIRERVVEDPRDAF
jgi:hypothetical protein